VQTQSESGGVGILRKNTKSLKQKERVVTKDEILATLREQKIYIQQKYEVDKIALFGSYAKEMATPQSDIDFYVVLKKKSIDNMTGLWLYLENLFDKKIDLLYHHPKIRQGLKTQIEQEAIYV